MAVAAKMGRNRSVRNKKRSLLRQALNSGLRPSNRNDNPNKFAPAPEDSSRNSSREVDTENGNHDADGKDGSGKHRGGGQNGSAMKKGKKKNKNKNRSRDARTSTGGTAPDPGVTEVTVRWADGVERTVKLSGGASGIDGVADALRSAGVGEVCGLLAVPILKFRVEEETLTWRDTE